MYCPSVFQNFHPRIQYSYELKQLEELDFLDVQLIRRGKQQEPEIKVIQTDPVEMKHTFNDCSL